MRRFLLGLVAALLLANPAAASGPPFANTYCLTNTANTSLSLSALVAFNNADNRIIAIGAGGNGFAGSGGNVSGAGGASGGFTYASNATTAATLTGPTITYQIGVGGGVTNVGGATYICSDNTNCASLIGTHVQVGTKGGSTPSGAGSQAGPNTSSNVPPANAAPGAASGAGGTTKGGGGGGAPPGINGAAGAGASGGSTFTGTGGRGDGGSGGIGGATASANGADGTEITCTAGDVIGSIGWGGGGAGADITGSATGGNGGGLGAGGGGGYGGTGAGGLGHSGGIIIQWNPATSGNHTGLLLRGVG